MSRSRKKPVPVKRPVAKVAKAAKAVAKPAGKTPKAVAAVAERKPEGQPPVFGRGGARHMPPALPRIIAGRLNALSGRVLHVFWMEGLLWFLVAFCGLVLVQCTLDWLFDLAKPIRALFLLADFAIFGFIVYRFGVLPWRRRLSPDEAALFAERHWPDLRTGLISAVQLARKPDGSPMLVSALLDRMAGTVGKLDLRLAVRMKQLTRLAFLAILLAIALVAGVVWLAPKSFMLLQRIVLFDVPLPTQTIVEAVSRDFSIPIGQTIKLEAKAKGVLPRSGRIEVTYEGRPPETVTVTPSSSSPETFALEIPNVQQPLAYRFYLNDGRGEEFKVELLHPPVVQEIKFELTNPPYTGLPPTQLSAGNLSFLAGSKLKITGKSSQPLKVWRLVLTGQDRFIEAKPEGADRTGFSAELDIPKEGLEGIWIALKNDRDMVSQNNTVYAIEVVPDKPPEITLAEGQPEKLNLVADQKPRLRFDVRDDFQVKQVFLCVQATNNLGEGEEPSPEKAKQIPITMPQPAAGLTFDYQWTDPGKTVDWAEGSTFTYWIKAVDNNNVTGPGISYSAPRQWSVVSLQTKREELAEQLRKHAESIKDLSGAQEGLRNQMGEMLKEDKK